MTAINVFGLAVGLASFIAIMLYIKYEFSFDKFNEKYEQIYRVNFSRIDPEENASNIASSPIPLRNLLDSIPFIEYRCGFTRSYDKMYISDNKKLDINTDGGIFADSTLFDVFTFRFLKGDKTALNGPFKVAVSESFAKKHFNTIEIIGKKLRADNQFNCTVTAVYEDIPANSHFTAKLIFSFATTETIFTDKIQNDWYSPVLYTYIVVKPENYETVENHIEQLTIPTNYKKKNISIKFSLTPLSDIHLFSHLDNEFKENRKLTDMLLFATVALSILLIACFNFINLSTAMAFTRAKETAIRKIVGASRYNLIVQFLGEAVFMAILGMLVAFFGLEVFIPVFNKVLQTNIVLHNISSISSYFLILSITVLTGLFSGIYPAYLISAFNPLDVMKGVVRTGVLSRMIRKVLVTSQFIVTIILVISSIFIFRQVVFFFQKPLGIDGKMVMHVNFLNPDKHTQKIFYDFKKHIEKIDDIERVTFSQGLPFNIKPAVYIQKAGNKIIEKPVSYYGIDSSFFDVYHIKLDTITDIAVNSEIRQCVVNQMFVNEFGVKNPVGKIIERSKYNKIKIAGICADFHYQSLSEPLKPLVMVYINPSDSLLFPPVFSLRLKNINNDTKRKIQNVFEQHFPNNAFSLSFLYAKFPKLYRRHAESGSLLANFAFLSIIIAMLGLLGLVAFTSKRRAKEIGIRKANGALTRDIIIMLIFEHLRLISVSLIIGFPVAYFVIDKWLGFFAYHVKISLIPFVITGIALIIVSSIIVFVQAFKTASRNPVESLKYE